MIPVGLGGGEGGPLRDRPKPSLGEREPGLSARLSPRAVGSRDIPAARVQPQPQPRLPEPGAGRFSSVRLCAPGTGSAAPDPGRALVALGPGDRCLVLVGPEVGQALSPGTGVLDSPPCSHYALAGTPSQLLPYPALVSSSLRPGTPSLPTLVGSRTVCSPAALDFLRLLGAGG